MKSSIYATKRIVGVRKLPNDLKEDATHEKNNRIS